MIIVPQLQNIPTPSPAPKPATAPQHSPRRFPDFLSAFEDYSRDGFTPPLFNTWAGLSIIAGALERKVWLRWNDTLRFYPNVYVLLVSLPGAGKSTAVNRAVGLLEELYRDERRVNFLPSQVTEAKLISLMTQKGRFYYQGEEHFHCSAYYYASEASDSLKEIYGDITTTMTNLYDCPNFWQKATQKDGMITVENGCLNLLAGSTFNYLNKLVSEDNIGGGFASRLTYIVSRDESLKAMAFPENDLTGSRKGEEARANLVHDLKRINEMTGQFSSTPEFRAAWAEWDDQAQRRRLAIKSESLKTLLIRSRTTMIKLCMIMSASESSDRIMKLPHLEKAEKLLRVAENDLPNIFLESRAGNKSTSDGLRSSLIMQLSRGPIPKRQLASNLHGAGFEPQKIKTLIEFLISNGELELQGDKVRLLVDSN